MQRFILTLTVLVLFLLEGTVVQVIATATWGLSWMTVPRFALVCCILISMFMGRREGLYYGLAFGFLQDVLFGQVIGIYTMSMMVASYFAGLIVLLFQRGFGMVFVTSALILFGHEWLLYSLFRLFSAAPYDVQWMLNRQILPSVILNLVVTLLIYVPIMRMCNKIQAKKRDLHAE
ncbi:MULTISPECIES: rod shape-determining protein MreD [Brevibacillus]|jgi:rod shape-determining protein MreD|uniref:Rod shape-determining protein MreD n=2 Tax=Brevibacillus TaxID=55080 RepID=A0A1I3WPH7_9BACL|nr:MULTISPECIES: rod shape-determining protein MreD [Brevibacillus]MEC2131129.1 rod shape-determining protein MreD [Brevibacillus centrosporus]MED1792553.1 rod shape-determining protein MreD [Brevibacillus nitrificans]MED1952565.1 rod shape-determining protein MreD [Brevibacillus centrosporus]MED4911757.1 rod shape-determining protein MreD [Brevibacillus centrosporus]RNB72978.1 rod shape-determining protein MreD [Brevibacillus centrosporus]